MDGKYKAYSEYQDSGNEWLGKIPAHWDAWKWKHALSEAMQYGANEAALDDDRNNPRYIRITDMNPDGSLRDESFKSLPNDIAENYLLQDGDILVARTGATVGKSFLYKKEFGPCCFAGYLIRARTDKRVVESEFVYWFLQSDQFWKYISGSQIQATIQNVSAEKYGDMEFAIPSKPEERKTIANFLDHETTKIDTLIEEQQSLIRLLKEKRQAVISHAVTKGLNPDAPMKDSGVEWLGEVPEHWDITRIGWLCDFISYGFTNPMPSVDEGPYMLTAADINYGNIKYESARRTSKEAFDTLLSAKSKPQRGDLLLTKDGTLGRVAVFSGEHATCISQSVALLRLHQKLVMPEFLSMALVGADYQKKMIFDAGGTTIKHIYISILAKMNFALPSLSEQKVILKELNNKLAQMDLLIVQAQEASTLLTERRTALISAAVTGKIDVRDWQPEAQQQEHPTEATA